MARLAQLMRQPEFQVFAFCIFFMLINWPFLDVPARSGLMSIFIYVFVLWGLFIGLLFLIQIHLKDDSSSEEEDDDGGG